MSDPAERDANPAYRPLPAPARPDLTLVATVMLAFIALAGTIALLPSSEEKAEGLLVEGRYDDAIEMLVAVEDERPLNAYEGYVLFKLYLLTGQADDGAILLNREPALQGNRNWALRQLSDLYHEAGNVRGEISVLRELYDAGPTDADFIRLRLLYRLTGDVDNEASLLSQAIASGRTDKVHVDRLAYLKTLQQSGTQAAVWVAPASSFSGLATTTTSQVVAQSDIATPTLTSIE